MSYEDPIVKEVRESRKRHSEKHGFDLARICESLRERERTTTRVVERPEDAKAENGSVSRQTGT